MNSTVSYCATLTGEARLAYAIMFPDVDASQIPTYVIVPQDEVAIGNATRVWFDVAPPDEADQFVPLLVTATRWYAPPEGSPAVDPVEASESVAVHSPK